MERVHGRRKVHVQASMSTVSRSSSHLTHGTRNHHTALCYIVTVQQLVSCDTIGNATVYVTQFSSLFHILSQKT